MKRSIARYFASDDELETTSLDELNDDLSDFDNNLKNGDANFKSELDYDGYHSIEESDNNAYNSLDLERDEDRDDEIQFTDREEEEGLGEESVIDPQENRA